MVSLSNAIQSDLVVEDDEAMFEQPFALDFLQSAFVSAGRYQLAFAIPGDHVEEVAGRRCAVAIELHGEVRNHVPQLRAAFSEPGKAASEFADRRAPE